MIQKFTKLDDLQTVLTEFTGQSNINIAIKELLTDYLQTKLFQLNVNKMQFEMNRNMNYQEFENWLSTHENGAKWEMEQEYYKWGEVISELEYFQKLNKKWK